VELWLEQLGSVLLPTVRLEATSSTQPDRRRVESQSEKKDTHVDQYGDPLPEGAVTRLGTVRLRHGAEPTSLVFSPDGRKLASTSKDSTIRLWDVSSGRQIWRLDEHKSPRICIAFSRDGKTLASSGEDRQLLLWDVETGRIKVRLGWQAFAISALGFAPDGKTLATVSVEGHIRLWDLATNKTVRELAGSEAEVNAVAFSSDGKLLAGGGPSNSICVWERATGKPLSSLHGSRLHLKVGTSRDSGICYVGFSSDTKVLIAASRGEGEEEKSELKAWNLTTGEQTVNPSSNDSGIWSVAPSPDGTMLALGMKHGQIELRSVTTNQRIRTIGDRRHRVGRAIAWSSDGNILASGGEGNTIHLWEAKTGNWLNQFPGHVGSVDSVAFLSNHIVASAGDDHTARLWEIPSGREYRRFDFVRTLQCPAVISADGKSLAFMETSSIRLCETGTGDRVREFPVEQAPANSAIVLSSNGKRMAAHLADGTIRVWDTSTGTELKGLGSSADREEYWCCGISLSPDGTLLGSIDKRGIGNIDLWNVVSKKSRLLGDLTGEEERPLLFAGPLGWRRASAFSPTGHIVAIEGDGGSIHLWDGITGRERRRLKGHNGATNALAFSPDSRILASGGEDTTVRLWDLVTGQELRRYEGHAGEITWLAFSIDGSMLASASQDTSVLIWAMPSTRAHEVAVGAQLSATALDSLWRELQTLDSQKADSVFWQMVLNPDQTLSFLTKTLHRATERNEHEVENLILELGSTDFKARARAMQELREVADSAERYLTRAWNRTSSSEARRRITDILEARDPAKWPERLRQVRAIEILELIATPSAIELLRDLAQGAPDACLTQEAKAAVQRLGNSVRSLRPGTN
jgi:WD40 repeat protein